MKISIPFSDFLSSEKRYQHIRMIKGPHFPWTVLVFGVCPLPRKGPHFKEPSKKPDQHSLQKQKNKRKLKIKKKIKSCIFTACENENIQHTQKVLNI